MKNRSDDLDRSGKRFPWHQSIQATLPLATQLLKFGGVGLAATAVHVAVFSGLMEGFVLKAWLANLLAFCVTVTFSYFGHFHWTFKISRTAKAERRPGSFPRFFVTAGLGLFLNTVAAFVIVDITGHAYIWAVLVMLFIVPVITFLIAKFWAFRF